MHADFESVIYKAETNYLQPPEIEAFKHCLLSLSERLVIYECLRDRELEIFQPVAEQLVASLSGEKLEDLEMALKHWLSILRYCAMAMLMNNPEFLQHRLLEWLTPVIQAHNLGSIEHTLYQCLLSQLKTVLSNQQLSLLQPFLEQAQTTSIDDRNLSQIGV